MVRRHICKIAIALLPLAGCGKISTDSIGNLVGGDAGHGIKALGHAGKAATLGEKDEDALGQSVGVSLTNTYPVLKNDAMTKYVTLVGLTVASTCPRPDQRFVFGILDTPEVNAFSGPNGYIFITRGCLSNLKDEAELAGVLGHEMSHVLLHHGLKQVQAAENQAALSEAAQASSAAQFSELADRSVDAITKTGYTQPQEFEADKSSVQLMSAAGYNPANYLAFLKRLAALQAGGGGAMSTHPDAVDRVKKVSDQLKTIPPGGAVLADRYHQNVAG